MTTAFRYCGLGKETAYGTAVDATVHLDITGSTLNTPPNREVLYQGGLNKAKKTRHVGYHRYSGNVDLAVDEDSIGWLLRGVLNGYVYTAGAGLVHTHEFYGDNATQLPFWTFRIGKDVKEHIYAGAVMESLDLKINNGFVSATVALGGGPETDGTIKTYPSLTLPTATPWGFNQALVYNDATNKSALYRDLTISIKNAVNWDSAKGTGSMWPVRSPGVNGREVTASGTLWFEDNTELESYWGGSTGPQSAGADNFVWKVTIAATDNANLEIDFTDAIYTSVGAPVQGTDAITQSVNVTALYTAKTLADAATSVQTEIYAKLANFHATYGA